MSLDDFPEFIAPFGPMDSFCWADDVESETATFAILDTQKAKQCQKRKTSNKRAEEDKLLSEFEAMMKTKHKDEKSKRKDAIFPVWVDADAKVIVCSKQSYREQCEEDVDDIDSMFYWCIKKLEGGKMLYRNFLRQCQVVETQKRNSYEIKIIKYDDVIWAKQRVITYRMTYRNLTDEDRDRCFADIADIDVIKVGVLPVKSSRITEYTRGLERIVRIDTSLSTICKDYFKNETCEAGRGCPFVHVSKAV